MQRVGGIVLCGGESKRMGRSKAWLPFGGALMLQRVVRVLAEVVRPIVVVAAPNQDVPALPPDVLIARDQEKGRGPLQGLAAGLSALSGQADAAYLSGCDVPFLKPAFVRRVIDLLGSYCICVPKVGGYFHPLAAVYHLNILDTVAGLLAEDGRGPVSLFERVPTRAIHEADLAGVDPGFRSLRNLNTAEDYLTALREINGG